MWEYLEYGARNCICHMMSPRLDGSRPTPKTMQHMKILFYLGCISENVIFVQFYVIFPDKPPFIQSALKVIKSNLVIF